MKKTMTKELSVEQIKDIRRAQECRVDDYELNEADATSKEVLLLCDMALAKIEQAEQFPPTVDNMARMLEGPVEQAAQHVHTIKCRAHGCNISSWQEDLRGSDGSRGTSGGSATESPAGRSDPHPHAEQAAQEPVVIYQGKRLTPVGTNECWGELTDNTDDLPVGTPLYLRSARGAEPLSAIELSIMFHHTYERLAPSVGYDTRKETRIFDPESANGKLMIAVCAELLPKLRTPGWNAGVEAAAKACERVADNLEQAGKYEAATGAAICLNSIRALLKEEENESL